MEILMPLFADLLRFPLVGPEKLMMREFIAFPDYFFSRNKSAFFKGFSDLGFVLRSFAFQVNIH